jgi:quinol monooxygenase YgiN
MTSLPDAVQAASGPPVVIFATFMPKPGCEREVRLTLDALVSPTRRESGCLRFDLHAGVGPHATFHLFEVFADEQAVDAHRDTDHYRRYRAAVMPLLQTPPAVVRMTPIDAAGIQSS